MCWSPIAMRVRWPKLGSVLAGLGVIVDGATALELAEGDADSIDDTATGGVAEAASALDDALRAHDAAAADVGQPATDHRGLGDRAVREPDGRLLQIGSDERR